MALQNASQTLGPSREVSEDKKRAQMRITGEECGGAHTERHSVSVTRISQAGRKERDKRRRVRGAEMKMNGKEHGIS